MNDADVRDIEAWVIGQGLAGADASDLVRGFAERCAAAGLGVGRTIMLIDTLHPIYEGRAYRWREEGLTEPAVVEYGSSDEGEAAANWQSSVFFRMLEDGIDEVRHRLGRGETGGYRLLEEMRDEGFHDHVAHITKFPAGGTIGGMDCVYSYIATRRPDGFSDEGLAALRRLLPALALAMKCGALAGVAATLVEVYLGRDAGRRVLSGRISRGVAEKLGAVLWFSDLRGFTTITDSAAPGEIIPLLNDYAEAVITSVHDAGGDVLKLIGDGTLAVFTGADRAEACRAALKAERKLRHRLGILNERRAAEGRPVTGVYLGLHVGDVLYGNIGSRERLDFTVVGPAVNEVARIASMCRSVDRFVVMSSDFADATPEPQRSQLVSVGRYALRGVGRAQELFTLDPAIA
ncbi:adenylate/guanylate cyclase domain-containing protein [Pseudoxanthobacter sp. M-2]|uniref:adenylate/guanylate cyclase domain-containing protein n=1 Tax=Pseudoxanthobacter sp. M-2 TaxID=3078754 RepID=UPI0038FC0E3E